MLKIKSNMYKHHESTGNITAVIPPRLHLLPLYHWFKVFLLPLSSFTTNFSSIMPNCFLEADIGPIPASATFHYSQKLNTWRPPLELPSFHIRSKLPFSSWEKKGFYFGVFSFFFRQPSQSCGCTITALIMISIRANQSQSGCSPLKLHANLGLNEPHLTMILSPAPWLHWSS